MHIRFPFSAFVKLAQDAYENQPEFADYDEWKLHHNQNNSNFHFWYELIDLECLLFSFVKSLREANFQLFLTCLQAISH